MAAAWSKPPHGTSTQPNPAADAFAAVNLALVFMMFIGFGIFAWVLYRRGKAPNPEQDLIEDLHDEEMQERSRRPEDKRRVNGSAEDEQQREPWEKPGDWWQKE